MGQAKIKNADLTSEVTQRQVPSGGTTNQVLAKNSNADYDLSWHTASGGADFSTEYTTTSPSAPATGITPFARKRTGKTMLSNIGIRGGTMEMQPHFGFKRVMYAATAWNETNLWPFGMAFPSVVGTSLSRSINTSNLLFQTKRIGLQSSATAGSTASMRHSAVQLFWIGNASFRGGFYYCHKFGIIQRATNDLFYAGLTASTSAIAATTAPSSQINILGVGLDSTDTTFQIMYNDAAGAATRVDTGISPSTTTVYCLRIYCEPNGSTIYISLEDMGGSTVYEASTATDIPGSTTLLTWIQHMSNNATSSAIIHEFVEIYAETEI